MIVGRGTGGVLIEEVALLTVLTRYSDPMLTLFVITRRNVNNVRRTISASTLTGKPLTMPLDLPSWPEQRKGNVNPIKGEYLGPSCVVPSPDLSDAISEGVGLSMIYIRWWTRQSGVSTVWGNLSFMIPLVA